MPDKELHRLRRHRQIRPADTTSGRSSSPPRNWTRIELVGDRSGRRSWPTRARAICRPSIWPTGRPTFTADLLCSRCVEPFPFANSSEFHLRFRPRPEISEENAEVEITPDELDVEFYTERSIPLRDLAAEQIQLAIPMKPLCTESCLGLCPQCGANRNGEALRVRGRRSSTTRWGALAGIREELAKKNEQ